MDNKFAISLAIVSLLALFVLAGCSSQQTQAPQPGPQASQTPAEEANPVIVVPEVQGQQPATTPPAQPENNLPGEQPPTGEPSQPAAGEQPQNPPSTAPAEEEKPPRLGVNLPSAPILSHARFMVTVPGNTPPNSVIYLETYDVEGSVWRMYQMENDEYLGWTVELDLATSGGVEGDFFHYRYSRDGKGYETAEKFAVFEGPNVYRSRPLSEVLGKELADMVTEWRDIS